jgi:hypothetical protein
MCGCLHRDSRYLCYRLEFPQMPDLSHRTLAHVMKVLGSLVPEKADTYPRRRELWQQMLFKWGFDEWLIDNASKSSYDWTTLIRELFAGKAKARIRRGLPFIVPLPIQKSILKKLAAMAITESEDTEDARELRRNLELDGFDVVHGDIVPIEGPISVTEEKTRLLANLTDSSFARKDLIAKHLKDAEDLFSAGRMHPALGEARSALQAGVEDTVSLVETKTKRKSGGGFKNQIDFLAKENFISTDEQQAFLAAWGFLSAGGHPGLPPDEAGRVGFVLGVEFTQVLLIKAKNLI